MKKIIDLHTHLETLHPIVHFRNKLQGHLIDVKGHLRKDPDTKVILGAAMYVQVYQGYADLIKLTKEFVKHVESLGSDFKIIRTKADLESDFQVGVLLHVESARTMTQMHQQIPELFDLGIRGIIPIHFINNQFGDSGDDIYRRLKLKTKDNGLTDDGFRFIELCNKQEIWVDLSHATDRAADQMLEVTNFPMLSHIAIRDITNRPRNKNISFFQDVAKKNGIFGLTPWCHLIGDEADAYAKHITAANKHGLAKNICIGTDFGAPIKTYKSIKGLFDLGEIADQFDNGEDIRWNNGFEFFKRALPN